MKLLQAKASLSPRRTGCKSTPVRQETSLYDAIKVAFAALIGMITCNVAAQLIGTQPSSVEKGLHRVIQFGLVGENL